MILRGSEHFTGYEFVAFVSGCSSSPDQCA